MSDPTEMSSAKRATSSDDDTAKAGGPNWIPGSGCGFLIGGGCGVLLALCAVIGVIGVLIWLWIVFFGLHPWG